MPKIELFDYQKKFVSDIRNAMTKFPHVMATMPCGSGKSYCIADIAIRAVSKGSKVLILSHRLVLLRQNNESLEEYGLDEMIVLNDERDADLDQLLYCSSLQTLQSRIKTQKYRDFISSCDLILIDEAHLMFSNYLFESGLVDNTRIVGFSGSPRRSGSQRQLLLDWDIIVPSISVKELIKLGRLVPCRYFVVPDDISGIKVDNSTGDFQAKSNYEHFNSPEKYKGVLDQYKKHGDNRQFLCFCANVAHTIRTTVEFNKAGIKTAYTISNINKPNKPEKEEGVQWERYLDYKETYDLHQKYKHFSIDQSDVKKALESREIQGVSCISILSIGFDYKPLGCVIINRATQSLPLIIQIYARGVRASKGKKDCIILDMGTNVQRLGKSEDDFQWELAHIQSDTVGVPMMKECNPANKDSRGKHGCGRLVLASADICKCGHRFSNHKLEKRAELVEIVENDADRFDEMSVEGLKAYAKLNGYKQAWVWRTLFRRGEDEFKREMLKMGYKHPFIYRLIKQYK